MTVDITVDAAGAVQTVSVVDDGSGYAASEVITVVNFGRDTGIKTINNVGAADSSRTAGTYTIGASDYSGGTGSGEHLVLLSMVLVLQL